MKKLIFQILVLLTCATLANANVRVTGNGGDVIVSHKDGQADKVELLDYYEEREIRGHKIKLDPEKTVAENFKILISGLDIYNRALLATEFETFLTETLFLPNVELVDIPDSQHIAVPKGSKIEQIAIQAEPDYTKNKRYTIDEDLWKGLDSVGRAGLILHELLYKHLIASKRDGINSIPVRYLNGLLASDHYRHLGDDEKSAILTEVNLPLMMKGRFLIQHASTTPSGAVGRFAYSVLHNDESPEPYMKGFRLPVLQGGTRLVQVVADEKMEKIFSIEVAAEDLDLNMWPVKGNSMRAQGRLLIDLDQATGLATIRPSGPQKTLEVYGSGAGLHHCLEVRTLSAEEIECRNYNMAYRLRADRSFSFITFTDQNYSVVGRVFTYDNGGNLLSIAVQNLKYPNQVTPVPLWEGRFHFAQDGAQPLANYFQNIVATLPDRKSNEAILLREGETAYFKNNRYIRGGALTNFNNEINELSYQFLFRLLGGQTREPVEFHEDGSLKQGTVILKRGENGKAVPVKFIDVKGRNVIIDQSHTFIELTKKGKLVRHYKSTICEEILRSGSVF